VILKYFVASRLWLSLTGFIYAFVIVARDWRAIDRIGADTGYTYVPEAVNNNLLVIFKPFPEYFEISGRAAAELVAVFPIRYHAIASSTVVNFIWVGLGLLIYSIIFQETQDRFVSSLAGLALIVTPHASESSIGNIGMIKFPLTAAIALAYCSSRAILKYPKPIAVISFIAGLSQPILVVASIPLFGFLRSKNNLLRKKVIYLLAIVYGTFVIQIFKVGLDKSIEGRSGSSVKTLWPGMGLFWYSGLFFPSLFVAFLFLFGRITSIRNGKYSQIRNSLCISTIVLTVTCFVMGGIADRYFVAPMTLSWICGILFMADFIPCFKKFKLMMVAIAFTFAMVPVVKWFEAGWYLTSGPTWTSQVDKASEICDENPTAIVELRVSPSGYSEVSCSQIKDK